MIQPRITDAQSRIIDTDDADRVLADLAELMYRIACPTLRQILLETADEITEMLNAFSEEPTELVVEDTPTT